MFDVFTGTQFSIAVSPWTEESELAEGSISIFCHIVATLCRQFQVTAQFLLPSENPAQYDIHLQA
jgi:hypothetical protein